MRMLRRRLRMTILPSEWKAYTAGEPMEGGTEQNPVKYYLTEDMTLSDKVEVNGYAVLCTGIF